jgi:hypothetical protein
MFALAAQPEKPKLQRREILLLQLVKEDARVLGKLKSRIEWALLFHHIVRDSGGSKCRKYWPDADREWSWLLSCSESIRAARPFSLENLPLIEDYGGQDNARLINHEDEAMILLYIYDSK